MSARVYEYESAYSRQMILRDRLSNCIDDVYAGVAPQTIIRHCFAYNGVQWPPPVPTPSKLPSPKFWGRVTSPMDESGGAASIVTLFAK